MTGQIEILPAEGTDARRLSEIAFAAKGYWDYPAEWLNEWRPQLTFSEDDVANGTFFKLNADGNICGFYVLADVDGKMWLEHLWLDPDSIGKGFGRKLFEHSMQTARDLGASSVNIESDPNAEGFYAAMGAVRIGESRSTILGSERSLPLLEIKL